MMKRAPGKALRLIDQFEAAVREHAFVGAAHPQDQHAIEKAYASTRERLLKALGEDQ